MLGRENPQIGVLRMTIPTEPIGSIPRPLALIEAIATRDGTDPDYMKPDQRIFVGVVAPIDPRVETPEEICDRILEAAKFIPVEQLGTTDDCGFSPFCDDTSTSRDTAFEKIRARVLGTVLASRIIGGGW